jgi:hypothetical protein
VIIHDWVVDAVAAHGLLDGLGGALFREFSGVHADHGHRVGETDFELPQLREDVKAIYSAEGPEVQDHQLAAQVG